MARKKMWFGNARYGVYLPTPDTGMTRNRVGWSASGTYLNGGGWSRGTTTKHMEPSMSWSFLDHKSVRLIEDFYNGVHGPGPFFWGDPFAETTNMLPPYVSAPAMMLDGAPRKWFDGSFSVTSNSSGIYGTPTYGIRVDSFTSGGVLLRATVPTDKALVFDARGTGTWDFEIENGNNVINTGVSGLNDPVWFPNVLQGDGNNLNTSITLTYATPGSTLFALTAKIVPLGAPLPAPDPWLSGAGHSGCEFKDLSVTGYSSPDAIDYQSVTANFVEVGAWR